MKNPIEKWRREDALRKAEVAYITDDQCRPAEYWWQQICSELMALPTFMKRVVEGKWVVRRDRYRAGIQQDVLRKYKSIAVRGRLEELKEIQEIRQNTLELIQPTVIGGQKVYRVHPQSYEGMVRALVHIDALADSKRDSVLRMVEPELASEIQKPQTVFSPDEIRGIARMLLESRRNKQQQLLEAPREGKAAIDATDDEKEDDPDRDGIEED